MAAVRGAVVAVTGRVRTQRGHALPQRCRVQGALALSKSTSCHRESSSPFSCALV